MRRADDAIGLSLVGRLVGGNWHSRHAAPGCCRACAADQKGAAKQTGPVSYYRQVRPILQRSCSGCHQPAKQGGKLLLTSYDGFKAGGENGPAFVAGKPDESLVVQYISGPKPEMPKNGEPLKPLQVELISKWIGQGAKDDTPASVQDPVTAENPPKYSSPPVIPALAYSPDSSLLAVSGLPRSPAAQGRRFGAGRPADRAGTADRIGRLFSRRQDSRSRRRNAGPLG